MADMEVVLSWLGMLQYSDRLVQAGFDSWETLQEITESDLETLEIGLGFRRKLQREIVRAKHHPLDLPSRISQRLSLLPPDGGSLDSMEVPPSIKEEVGDDKEDAAKHMEIPAKRSYRHHPKPDPNAPERPYSAYVLFSNHVREQVKDENLPFPELSRQVGVRWQNLLPQEKERWKKLAAGPWEAYKEKVSAYQQTEKYKDYKLYVESFKSAQANKQRGNPPKQQRKSSSFTATYPTPGHTPAAASIRTLSTSQTPKEAGLKALKQMKGSPGTKVTSGQNQWPNHEKLACEPCNQNMVKCNGQMPSCRRCLDTGQECFYMTVRMEEQEDRFSIVLQKLDECKSLLTRVKSQLRPEDQQILQAAIENWPSSDSTANVLRNGNLSTPLTKGQNLGYESSLEDDDDDQSDASEKSGVGSMGSTDHVNQDDFGFEGTEMRARAFMGNASDLQWLRRLHWELEDNNSLGQELPSTAARGALPHLKSHFNSFFAEDMDRAIVGDQIDPFGLPIKSTADHLVNSYFNTIHLVLPILDKGSFLMQYKLLSSTWYAETFEDNMFIIMLQLVFACGAVHAHLSGSESIQDDRDHLLYSARARLLAVESGIMNDVSHVAQVQVFALGAMYSLVSDRIDRAWYLSGLSIRCAQSLGIHLENVTPTLPVAGKRFQARMWFSLLSLDRCLCIMTGRPSMVQENSYTVLFPADFEEGTRNTTKTQTATKSPQYDNISVSSFGESQNSSGMSPQPFRAPVETAFFRRYLELTSVVEEVLPQLYGPDVREEGTAEVHVLIETFDKRLVAWQSKLEDLFKRPTTYGADTLLPHGTALNLFFHTARIIINRPSLCKIDMKSTSEHSKAAIMRCVRSARSIINTVCTGQLPTLLHHSPMWWMLLHHHKRALTIILLELSYRAEHMPSQKEDLLSDAKRGIEWIGSMGGTSNAAQQSFSSMARYLQLAITRVGADPTRWQVNPEAPVWAQNNQRTREQRPQNPSQTFGQQHPSLSFEQGHHQNTEVSNPLFDPAAFSNFHPFINETSTGFQTTNLASHNYTPNFPNDPQAIMGDMDLDLLQHPWPLSIGQGHVSQATATAPAPAPAAGLSGTSQLQTGQPGQQSGYHPGDEYINYGSE